MCDIIWVSPQEHWSESESLYFFLGAPQWFSKWQQHTTNEEPLGKMPSAIQQLRQLRLTFAGHYYMHEDQPVKLGLDNVAASHKLNSDSVVHVVKWLTYFSGRWIIRMSGHQYHIRVPSDCKVSIDGWMNGRLSNYGCVAVGTVSCRHFRSETEILLSTETHQHLWTLSTHWRFVNTYY